MVISVTMRTVNFTPARLKNQKRKIQKMLQDLTLGSDPEVFIRHKETGEIVPAINLTSGTKGEPEPVSSNVGVLWDGFALELNPTPVPVQDFSEHMNKVYMDVVDWLPDELEISPEITLDIEPFIGQHYPPDMFDLQCSPDFSIYGVGETKTITKSPFRSAGGHLHVGGEEVCENVEQLTKFMDFFLGLPSVHDALDPVAERQRRTKGYGSAGSIRNKPYGLEYRVLSSQWFIQKEFDKIQRQFEETVEAFHKVKAIENIFQALQIEEKDLINWINRCNNVQKIEELFSTYYNLLKE